MIITTDFLVGCGFSPRNCTRTLKNMEQVLVQHGGTSSRVSVYDICDRLTYNGLSIANPIVGSFSNMCLIVPMDKLGLLFYNSTHPSAKSIGNYMSCLFNAAVVYTLEKSNQKLDNFEKEIRFAKNEVNLLVSERSVLEEKLKESKKLYAASEEQRILFEMCIKVLNCIIQI
ncbi:WSSV206 [White spot syndrome virus]|uniref:WSSV206 n=1 Tax=White spot syndrome virus TaxID=342409 RepID=A0A2I6SBU2_9VIRU|nr:WSSV206 [White spot syndrome virus]